MTSPLLISEHPLMVLPTLAVAIGLKEAIILQQVHYWITNKDKRSKPYERDGKKWVYNTYEEWQEQFPFWSVVTIKRTIISAESKGVLASSQFDLNAGDAKKYYTVNYDALNKLISNYPSDQIDPMPSDQNDLNHQIKLIRPSDQIDPTIRSKRSDLNKETETTTETNPETTRETRARKPKTDSFVTPFTSESETPESDHPEINLLAASVFEKVFKVSPTNFQQEQFGQIEDLKVWEGTLRDWVLNGYSIRNVAGMLRQYRADVIGASVSNGSHLRGGKIETRQERNNRNIRDSFTQIFGTDIFSQDTAGSDVDHQIAGLLQS